MPHGTVAPEVTCSRPCSSKLVCRRVVRAGVVYRCVTALSEALGINRPAVYQSLHRHGDAEHCGTGKGIKPGRGYIGNNRRPVSMCGHSWPSVSAMARDLGIGRSMLSKALKHDPESVIPHILRWSARHERAASRVRSSHL